MTFVTSDSDTSDIMDEIDPDIDAAYQQADSQDSVGMRALAGLFLLEHEFRRAPGAAHLARLVVNRLNRFAPYDCAVFWTCSPRGRIYDVTISGIVKDNEKNKDTKQVLAWGEKLGAWLSKADYRNSQITPEMIDDDASMADWPDNLPKSGLYVPLHRQDGKLRGGIVLLRESQWSQPVRVMLDQLAEAAAYTVDALDAGVHGATFARGRFGRLIGLGVGLVLLALSFFINVPVTVDVPARLAVAATLGDLPRGPAQIDLQMPPQGAMALRPGSLLKTNYQGTAYEFEVEHISPWIAGLFADRHIRARVTVAPDGLAPPALQSITIENASMPLPLYVMRVPINAMRARFNLNFRVTE